MNMHIRMPAASVLFGFLLLFSALAGAADKTDCHVGSYRLNDGRAVDIAPADDNTLRWRMFTGETGKLHSQANGSWTSTYGWTDRPDGKTVSFSDCGKGEMRFGSEIGHRIPMD